MQDIKARQLGQRAEQPVVTARDEERLGKGEHLGPHGRDGDAAVGANVFESADEPVSLQLGDSLGRDTVQQGRPEEHGAPASKGVRRDSLLVLGKDGVGDANGIWNDGGDLVDILQQQAAEALVRGGPEGVDVLDGVEQKLTAQIGDADDQLGDEVQGVQSACVLAVVGDELSRPDAKVLDIFRGHDELGVAPARGVVVDEGGGAPPVKVLLQVAAFVHHGLQFLDDVVRGDGFDAHLNLLGLASQPTDAEHALIELGLGRLIEDDTPAVGMIDGWQIFGDEGAGEELIAISRRTRERRKRQARTFWIKTKLKKSRP